MADESKQPKAWRVEKIQRIADPKLGDVFRADLTPVYYGDDEDGPKVGGVLVPGEVRA